MPTEKEVLPWVETIMDLWDHPDLYAVQQQRCRKAAEAWRPDRLLPLYEEFFAKVCRPARS